MRRLTPLASAALALALAAPTVAAELPTEPMSAEDAAALSAVGTDSFLAAYGDTGDPQAIAEHVELLFAPRNIVAEMATAEADYKIAMIGNSATGLMKLRSGNVPDALERRRVLELQQLYVHSDYQGYGIGRALIDAAVRYARAHDYEAIWLQAWSNR